MRLTFLPTPTQELLLKAALDGDSTAVDAWRQWRQVADLNAIDSGSYRLLPLAYLNLHRYELDDPFMQKVKGIYRKTWLANQLIERSARQLVQILNVDVVLLKGLDLTLRYYPSYGARPMEDFDVLIRLADLEAVVETLARNGWVPLDPISEARTAYIHSVNYRHPHWDDFDLHWRPFEEACGISTTQDFWDDVREFSSWEPNVYDLSPTDQLLHILVHGARWSTVPPIRWVQDALIIMRHAQDAIQWNRFRDFAARFHVVLPVRDTLSYLKNRFDAPVPDDVIGALEAVTVPANFRREYLNKVAPLTPLRRIIFHWFNHTRQTFGHSLLRRILTWPRYLRYRWGIDDLRVLPGFTVRKVRRYSAGK